MKKVLLLVVIVLGVIFIMSLGNPLSRVASIGGTGDVLNKERDYRDPAHFKLDGVQMPTIGVTKEADIYTLFGSDFDRRLTFKTPREKTINGTTFSFNKIIAYQDYTYVLSNETKNGEEVRTGEPVGRDEAVIYLLDGEVRFYAVRKQVKEGTDYVSVSPSENLDESGDVWPNSMADIADYRSQ
ncbi:hypothetical protein KBA63_03910 [Candidatus Woesebacteria bacterium]|jgi:hypothetical protein|nr:hypothetical protein [Candidatus Woesebacteria bacterium]